MVNKKILFILHLPPPVHGSSIVGEQIKNSQRINNAIDGHYINIGTTISMDKIGKHGISKLFRFLIILWKVLWELLKWKPDLCYFAINARGAAFYRDLMVVILFKLFKVKIVYHFHNKGVRSRQDKFVDNLLYRYAFKNSEVILLSKLLYPDIEKYVSKEQVYYCPNGISDKKIEVQQKVVGDLVNILFLSNIMKTKGVFVLLEACKILQDKGLNFFCNFVGGEGDINKKMFQSKVDNLSLNNRIHYAGKKIGLEKEEYFAGADIFAFPTYYHYETFGIVNLEAMQYSLPVISTHEGGIPDVVVDGVTGFLVNKKDPVSLAEKLEILIINPKLRRQMGESGCAKYQREFTLEIFENRLLQILEFIH
jgi:glycosyltransferase involved in cell wall biosynthesis